MIEQSRPRSYFTVLLAALISVAANLFLIDVAVAQEQAGISASDLPDGVSTSNNSFFDYIGNNSYINLGVRYLHYSGSSSNLAVQDPNLSPLLNLGHGRPPSDTYEWLDTGAGIDSKALPSLTLGMFLPNTNHHLSIETMLSAPLDITVELRGKAINEALVPGVLHPVGKTVGTTKALLPNLAFVYRPWVDTTIQPYVGIGAMYIYTYDNKITNSVLTNYNGDPSLYLSKPIACMAQLGMDFLLPHNMFINADVKYIGCADIKVRARNVRVPDPMAQPGGITSLDTISSTIKFEALLYSLNIGIRF